MTIAISFEGKKGVNANVGGFIVKTDQPIDSGGNGTAPSPFDLFLASIATCSGVYVKSFCDNRNLPTEGIKIFQHAEYDSETKLVSKLNLEIVVPASFPEKYRDALAEVAGKCKVKKQIKNPPEFNVCTTVEK
ncbi:MAG: OsmC family protein [Bacteroidales bacterium]|jgi:ribosomal protein S12 methylthiotransferase accessory factor